MAKLAATTCGSFKKADGEAWEAWSERIEGLLAEMQAVSAKVNPEGKSLVGALVQFSVADGYAYYRVCKDSPLTVEHVPYGDSYQAHEATVRGITANTVRTALQRSKMFSSMTDVNEEWYASLKAGQIVHYNGSFGAWQRCEVVRGKHPLTGKDQNVLKVIALVGDWRPYDLPKRTADGGIVLGHAVDSIQSGKTMMPHESNIWESPRCANKARMIADGWKDPATLAPVSLEVPALSAEEEAKAALWRKVGRLRAICNDRVEDPQSILDAVRQAVA